MRALVLQVSISAGDEDLVSLLAHRLTPVVRGPGVWVDGYIMADRSQSSKRRWMVTAARGQTDLEVFVENF